MTNQDVYITSVGKFLPGEPIANDEAEKYLGFINGKPSRQRAFVQRQNKIKQRYYALDQKGNHLYTNAQLAANAIKDAVSKSELNESDIALISAATTQGDLLVPGFASQVHGELKIPPIEVASFQSVCASSMMATQNAYLHIKSGEKAAATVCASEFSSRFFRPGFYEDAYQNNHVEEPSFEAEFLRWTLSDGGGALLLEPRANARGNSLKIEWIDLCSYADRFYNCMYAGTADNKNVQPWNAYASPGEASSSGAITLLQDFELLYKMFPTWVSHYLNLIEKGKIVVDEIDWFLAHYSSHSLRNEMVRLLEKTGGMIPEEKWFTNLYSKGNTGSASLFIMLEELLYEKDLKKGEKILCFVPESGRCIVSFMLLTVV